MVRFYEFCNVLKSDKRTKWKLLPMFEMPQFFFKWLFTKLAPLLGIDKSLPQRMWGNTVTVDLNKINSDFDLPGEGYEPIHIRESMVDMDLSFQTFRVSNFSKSLVRYSYEAPIAVLKRIEPTEHKPVRTYPYELV